MSNKRIRSIKPEVLEDEVAVALSDSAWRLWVSLWVLADDYGNTRASSRFLAAHVWQDTARDVDPLLDELVFAKRIECYAVAGQRYAHIRNWEKHQRINNAGNPRVPSPNADDVTWDQPLSVSSAEIRGEPPRDSEDIGSRVGGRVARARSPAAGRGEGRGKGEGEGGECEGSPSLGGAPPPPAPPPPPPVEKKPKRAPPTADRTPIAESFALTDDMARFATMRELDAPTEFARFRAKAESLGWTYADWPAAFRTWCLNEVKFAKERGSQQRIRAAVPIAPAPYHRRLDLDPDGTDGE
jgi:hypothetical protein